MTQLRTHDRSMSAEEIAVEAMKILLRTTNGSMSMLRIAEQSYHLALNMKLQKDGIECRASAEKLRKALESDKDEKNGHDSRSENR